MCSEIQVTILFEEKTNNVSLAKMFVMANVMKMFKLL